MHSDPFGRGVGVEAQNSIPHLQLNSKRVCVHLCAHTVAESTALCLRISSTL